ncbi:MULTISPECIES: hypothetical protein [Streptomyces]|uniref:hypothetical protein n=1 Tax=Streptomyces TaxID=1883 RepID=UPI001C580D74|nr:hypothetical protein [Streptomyces sp. 09ZI22]MBW3361519.1 hypothetical protein [Streptomyces sp. 09ZI22]
MLSSASGPGGERGVAAEETRGERDGLQGREVHEKGGSDLLDRTVVEPLLLDLDQELLHLLGDVVVGQGAGVLDARAQPVGELETVELGLIGMSGAGSIAHVADEVQFLEPNVADQPDLTAAAEQLLLVELGQVLLVLELLPPVVVLSATS